MSAVPAVRTLLVQRQRELADGSGSVVVEGRDIGTVVLPDADVKIFLTASAEERAQRDATIRMSRRAWATTTQAVLADVRRRDHLDSTRAVSPLRAADDAMIVDTSDMTESDAWSAHLLDLVEQRAGAEPMSACAKSDGSDERAPMRTAPGSTKATGSSATRRRGGRARRGVRRRRRSSPWSGGPTSASRRLVNRILGRREAVVQDIPGVTRDRVSYEANWIGRRFVVQDTGGWEPDAKGLQQLVAEQATVAMRTADAIILVVDAVVGATAADEAAAKRLQRAGKPVFLAANKVDSERVEAEAAALWSLGLGQPHSISAIHGRGVADLLDAVLEASARGVARSRPAAAVRGASRWSASRTSARARC